MRHWFVATLTVCVLGLSTTATADGGGELEWRVLPTPSVSDAGGAVSRADAFVGTHGDTLILAGGTDGDGALCDEILILRQVDTGGEGETFPDGRAAGDGPRYVWSEARVMPPGPKTGNASAPEEKTSAARLPRPMRAGLAVHTSAGVVCIADGGLGADVVLLKYDGEADAVDVRPLPAAPVASAGACAAAIGEVVYVLGAGAGESVWAIDLSAAAGKRGLRWVTLDTWDGPPRTAAACGVFGGKLYVFGGREDGEDARALADAYRFTPARGKGDALGGTWKRVADLPVPVADPASSAQPMGQSHLLLFAYGNVLAYHTITDTWRELGDMPARLRAGSAAVPWHGAIVIVSPGDNAMTLKVVRPAPRTVSFGVANWAALAGYLAVLVAMGVYFSRREKSTDDFFRAGRRVPWWAAGLSLFGTGLSAITFMSIPSRVYATNWGRILTSLIPLAVVPVIIVFYIPFYRRLNITSAYEYLERRFNLPVRLVGSTLFILAQFGRMGIVLFLPAIALTTVTGIDVYVCIALMGVLCTLYTVLGGIEAVIWSDVLQVVVLMGAAILSLVLIAGDIDGGLGAAYDIAVADGKLDAFDLSWDYTGEVVWVLVVGSLFSAMMQTADQSVVQRYLTTPNERAAKRALITTSVAGIFAAALFFSLGTALYVFFKTQPDLLDPTIPKDNEAIFPLFIMRQMRPGVAGLVVAGIFAASMSSLDSSMNSVATAVTTDFYRRFRPDVADRKALRFARWLTCLLGVFGTGAALLVASLEVDSLWGLFMGVAGLFGGGLAGLYALGIFTRRANGPGALVGILVSAATVLAVKQCTKVNFFLWAGIGIVTCFVIGYIASLILVPAKPKPIDGLTYYTIAPCEDGWTEGDRDAPGGHE